MANMRAQWTNINRAAAENATAWMKKGDGSRKDSENAVCIFSLLSLSITNNYMHSGLFKKNVFISSKNINMGDIYPMETGARIYHFTPVYK